MGVVLVLVLFIVLLMTNINSVIQEENPGKCQRSIWKACMFDDT